MTYRPIHDLVIVKRDEAETTTAGGIALNVRGKPSEGTVMSVGKGRVMENGRIRPMEVKIGDRVLFSNQACQTVIVKDEELVVMREEDVIAVLETA